MEGTAPFRLYKWDGESDAFMEAGEGLELIGSFMAPDPGWKAEGLFAFCRSLFNANEFVYVD